MREDGVPEQHLSDQETDGIDELDKSFPKDYSTIVESKTLPTRIEEESEEEKIKLIPSASFCVADPPSNSVKLTEKEYLYKEVLREIINPVGCTAEVKQEDLLQYLQKAFCIDLEEHSGLLHQAQMIEPPNILLNVQVLEAKDLKPYDPNGLSDPFCTLYLSSAPIYRLNTAVKEKTLDPVWEENFSLYPALGNLDDVRPLCRQRLRVAAATLQALAAADTHVGLGVNTALEITVKIYQLEMNGLLEWYSPIGNPRNDTLCLEVWDFDSAESVTEKMSQVTNVKGFRGFKKLVKDIATTVSSGKHDNAELIGKATVQLKNVPPTGQLIWLNLEKKNKRGCQGVIRVMVSFSSENNSQVATRDHRSLLTTFALHEIKSAQMNEKETISEWNGELSVLAKSILQQHVAQSGMTEAEEALAQWIEYATVSQTHTVSCQVFYNILQTLSGPVRSGLLTDKEEESFWDAAKKILPSCLKTIKRIRDLTPAEESTKSLLNYTLSILSTLSTVRPPPGTHLFPLSEYDWLTSEDYDIKSAFEDTITQVAIDWLFAHTVLKDTEVNENTEKSRLLRQRKMIELVKTDLQNAMVYFDFIFLKRLRSGDRAVVYVLLDSLAQCASDTVLGTFQVPYSKILYTAYERKITEMTEPLVKDICASLKPLRYKEKEWLEDTMGNDPQALGTSLFELYLDVKRFSDLGSAICPSEADNFQISQFHSWFSQGVAHWLDISVYKAMHHVEKAVELDKLIPIDSTVKYSSSAVDTVVIYNQVNTFWQQLLWPDVEESYIFVARIVDDICRCSIHYVDMMVQKLDRMGQKLNESEEYFKVTKKWCLAVNSIEYVRDSIKPFVKELNLDDIIDKLADLKNPSAAEHCQSTLQMFTDNAVESVMNNIFDLLVNVAEKMSPSITKFLTEGAEEADQKNHHVDQLVQYLDENLTTMSSHLSQENFEQVLTSTFDKVSHILFKVVQNGIKEKKSQQFFANLQQMLQTLIEFFQQGVHQSEILSRTQRLLAVHSMDTLDLITQVHLARLKEQQTMDNGTNGMLTVRLQFVQDTLRIEVMNARNLKPMDSNGSSDPYVTIHLLPEEKFVHVPKLRTKTQKRNLFPLFDENFSIQLTREQRLAKDAMLMFVVKDEDCFGVSSDFLGEAYYSLADVASTSAEMNIQQTQQIHLHLSEPSDFDCDEMKALDQRHGDKLAREFTKTQRSKRVKILTK